MPEVRAPLLVRAEGSRAPGFVAFEHSFHGRTIGALSVTWDDHYRAPFAPLLAGRAVRVAERSRRARWRPSPNRPAPSSSSRCRAKAACGRSASAMADAITEACRAHRRAAHRRRNPVRPRPHRAAVLFAGRSACKPDLMAVGKALGAGVPIAAALFSERVAKAAAFGDHGSTYGGNLLACRAALVFLEELDRPRPDLARRVGRRAPRARAARDRRAPLDRRAKCAARA